MNKIPSERSNEIYNAFSKYVKSGNRSLIEKVTPEEMKFTLLQYHLDKGWPAYMAIEQRISELGQNVDNDSRVKEAQITTNEYLNKDRFYKGYKQIILSVWPEIEKEFENSKRALGKKISFVKDVFKREIIFRDIEQAYLLSKMGFNKPAVILAGGVIEELLRIFLESKGENIKKKRFEELIEICEEKGLLKKEISNLASAIRRFRNSVHLATEKSKKYTISKATASATVALIFTIVNDFQKE